MSEIKTKYEIGGKVLEFGRIKMRRFINLTAALGKLDLGGKVDVSQIIPKIMEKYLPEFMEIIFADQDLSGINWLDQEYELIDEILESFFFLNPRLKVRLIQSFGFLISMDIGKLIKSPPDSPLK
jgi:hypothetical protein